MNPSVITVLFMLTGWGLLLVLAGLIGLAAQWAVNAWARLWQIGPPADYEMQSIRHDDEENP